MIKKDLCEAFLLKDDKARVLVCVENQPLNKLYDIKTVLVNERYNLDSCVDVEIILVVNPSQNGVSDFIEQS